jgi:hypothetical protein
MRATVCVLVSLKYGPWKPFVADRGNLSGSRGREPRVFFFFLYFFPCNFARSSLPPSSAPSPLLLRLLLLLLRRVSLESRMHGIASRFLAPSRDCSSNTRHVSQSARDEKFCSCKHALRIPGFLRRSRVDEGR